MFCASDFGIRNVIENQGLSIAITGMSIVFVALALVTTFIACLPRLLSILQGVLPPEREHPHAAPTVPTADPSPDEGLAVAIGYALHVRMMGGSKPK